MKKFINRLPLAALLLTLISLAFPGAFRLTADDAKPFDHGDEADATPYKYTEGTKVPANPPARPLAKLELPDQIYHGVLINTDDEWDFQHNLQQYEAVAGKKPSMIGTFDAVWYRGKKWDPDMFLYRLQMIDRVPNVVPFIKLYTGDWKPGGPFLHADDILAGKHDDYFTHIADLAKKFGKPFLLSINHEMNGNWFFYSQGYKAGKTDWTPEKFVKIWRRIHDIFEKEGATNVAFAWCPNIIGIKMDGKDALNNDELYYPGDQYVDWVGCSFYNDHNHLDMDTLATNHPNKPIIVAEWGTEPQRGKWYQPKPYPGDARHMEMTFEMFTKRYPNLKAMTYFYWGANDFIERVPAQVPVYRAGIAQPIFKSND